MIGERCDYGVRGQCLIWLLNWLRQLSESTQHVRVCVHAWAGGAGLQKIRSTAVLVRPGQGEGPPRARRPAQSGLGQLALSALRGRGGRIGLATGQLPKHKSSLKQSGERACGGGARGVGELQGDGGFSRYYGQLLSRAHGRRPVNRQTGVELPGTAVFLGPET